MSFVIFDTEYTTWKGCQQNGWHGTQKREIVQIAALKIAEDFEVISEFNMLCKPQINPVLSDYFINLTHISNADVAANGVLFAEALAKFIDFAGNNICYSHSWGSEYLNKSDGSVFDENIALYDLSIKNNLKYRNLAPVFKELYQRHGIAVKSQASGEIIKLLEIEKKKHINLDTHNALFDVYSLLEGLKYFGAESRELLKQYEASI